ncbi:hypothetical protein CVT24_010342, partial [Panaeolus cyanescens]
MADKKRGTLELMDMPLDILFETCNHLDPMDILELGRTTRAMKRLVLSPKFKPVWVKARSQYASLPACPEDLSEPAYAELIFGNTCLACGTLPLLHDQRRIFEARDRLCLDCFHRRYSLVERANMECLGLPAKVVRLLPQYMHEHEPNDSCRIKVDFYYSNAHLTSWLHQYVSHHSAEDKQRWEDAMVSQRGIISKHASLCLSWCQRRDDALVKYRTQRFLEVARELGYEDELDSSSFHSYEWHCMFLKMSRCQETLTDEVLQNLHPKIEAIMQRAKDKRLALKLQATYKARLEALNMAYSEARETYPKHLPYPHVCSIFSIPRIRSIVFDTPKTTTVTARDFNITPLNLTDVIAEATNAMHKIMLPSVISGLADKEFDPDTVM